MSDRGDTVIPDENNDVPIDPESKPTEEQGTSEEYTHRMIDRLYNPNLNIGDVNVSQTPSGSVLIDDNEKVPVIRGHKGAHNPPNYFDADFGAFPRAAALHPTYLNHDEGDPLYDGNLLILEQVRRNLGVIDSSAFGRRRNENPSVTFELDDGSTVKIVNKGAYYDVNRGWTGMGLTHNAYVLYSIILAVKYGDILDDDEQKFILIKSGRRENESAQQFLVEARDVPDSKEADREIEIHTGGGLYQYWVEEGILPKVWEPRQQGYNSERRENATSFEQIFSRTNGSLTTYMSTLKQLKKGYIEEEEVSDECFPQGITRIDNAFNRLEETLEERSRRTLREEYHQMHEILQNALFEAGFAFPGLEEEEELELKELIFKIEEENKVYKASIAAQVDLDPEIKEENIVYEASIAAQVDLDPEIKEEKEAFEGSIRAEMDFDIVMEDGTVIEGSIPAEIDFESVIDSSQVTLDPIRSRLEALISRSNAQGNAENFLLVVHGALLNLRRTYSELNINVENSEEIGEILVEARDLVTRLTEEFESMNNVITNSEVGAVTEDVNALQNISEIVEPQVVDITQIRDRIRALNEQLWEVVREDRFGLKYREYATPYGEMVNLSESLSGYLNMIDQFNRILQFNIEKPDRVNQLLHAFTGERRLSEALASEREKIDYNFALYEAVAANLDEFRKKIPLSEEELQKLLEEDETVSDEETEDNKWVEKYRTLYKELKERKAIYGLCVLAAGIRISDLKQENFFQYLVSQLKKPPSYKVQIAHQSDFYDQGDSASN